jgi:hypothetical protein
MTISILIPPFSVASFFHLSQIKELICGTQDLVFPLHEDIKIYVHILKD